MNYALAQSYSPYCAKTPSVGLIETADGVFGLHYCEESKGTIIAIYLSERMLKDLSIEYE
jgi:hypothetical protein